MDSDDLRPRFFQLTVVNILSNILIPLAGLIDLAFLGHLSDISFLAGVALATILFDYLYRTCNFFRLGTTGPTAQAVGRSDRETVQVILLRNSLIALAIGIIMLLLRYPLRELGFYLLSAAPDVIAAGKEYYDARIWGSPAVLLNYVLIGWLLGREQSGKVLVLTIVGNATSVLLDYLFINRWGWGSVGAGTASASSQYVMLVLAIIFICLEQDFSQVRGLAGRIFDREAIKATFELNGDIWIRTLVAVTAFAVFIDLSATLGTVVLATNTLLVEVLTVATFLFEGSAFATETLSGSFHGEGVTEKLAPLLRLSGGTSLSLGLSFASVLIVFPTPLFGLLTNHSEVIEEANHYILWLLPVLGSFALTFALEGYFLGLTQVNVIRNSTLYGVIFGFVPAAVAAWRFHDSQVLWLAMLLFFAIRAIAMGIQVGSSTKQPSTIKEPSTIEES